MRYLGARTCRHLKQRDRQAVCSNEVRRCPACLAGYVRRPLLGERVL